MTTPKSTTPAATTVEYKGETYFTTRRTGTRKDGVKGTEFASTKGNGKRLWVYTDGTTMEDN